MLDDDDRLDEPEYFAITEVDCAAGETDLGWSSREDVALFKAREAARRRWCPSGRCAGCCPTTRRDRSARVRCDGHQGIALRRSPRQAANDAARGRQRE